MFAKGKTDKKSIMSNPALRTPSNLSCSAVIKGEIKIEDDIRIDGNVEGNIYSSGKVIIGPDGCVKGKIAGKSIDVTGKIFGDVTVSDIVILRSTSYYEGHITARNIEIEAGASFFGNCKMEKEEKKIIPEIGHKNILPDKTEDRKVKSV